MNENVPLLREGVSRLDMVYISAESKQLWLVNDRLGMALSSLVWIAAAFIQLSIFLIFNDGILHKYYAILASIILIMALWAHLKTMITNPGVVPINAQPLEKHMHRRIKHICPICNSYKPPYAHHDRVSNRCISRMDHFCPWTNNAIGVRNQKHFLLFLIYLDIYAIYVYILVCAHTVICPQEKCEDEFRNARSIMGWVTMALSSFIFLYCSFLLINQWHGLRTGRGTIDRLQYEQSRQLRAGRKTVASPVPWKHVFGEINNANTTRSTTNNFSAGSASSTTVNLPVMSKCWEWVRHLLPLDPIFPREQLPDIFLYRLLPVTAGVGSSSSASIRVDAGTTTTTTTTTANVGTSNTIATSTTTTSAVSVAAMILAAPTGTNTSTHYRYSTLSARPSPPRSSSSSSSSSSYSSPYSITPPLIQEEEAEVKASDVESDTRNDREASTISPYHVNPYDYQ